MRVQVQRVSGMPHDVNFWLDDQPDIVTFYIDEKLITDTGAQILEGALSLIVRHWNRSPNLVERPRLHLHTG